MNRTLDNSATRFLAFLGLMFLVVFAQEIHAQAQSRSGTSTGSICVAALTRPTGGAKSLANAAGDNLISTYSVQVDKTPSVIASHDKPIRISALSPARRHLVKIIGDGKIVQSFYFRFSDFKSRELCLWFNALYETWSLWETKEAGAKCRCE